MRLPSLSAAAVASAMAGASVAAALTLATPARADFRICNNTATRASLALAYTNGSAWVSEGWWNLKANTCETLLRGALAAQFYYVYGIDEGGGEWKGKAFMCTRDREFRIDGRQDCFVRGFDRTGFFEIDTGKDAKDWTVQLTDPAKAGSAASVTPPPSLAQPALAPPAAVQPAPATANPATAGAGAAPTSTPTSAPSVKPAAPAAAPQPAPATPATPAR